MSAALGRDIVYRRAVAADAGALAALGATVWISTYATGGVLPVFAQYVLEHFTAERVRADLALPEARCWVAEASGALLGFCALRLGASTDGIADPHAVEVERLYVLERFTRGGIGRSLLRCAERDARAAGASTLWLAVYAGNARALAFYRAGGWSQVGDTVFPLGGESYLNHVFAKWPVGD